MSRHEPAKESEAIKSNKSKIFDTISLDISAWHQLKSREKQWRDMSSMLEDGEDHQMLP